MTFPVYFEIFSFKIHPHLMMEVLAYAIGFQVYLRGRKYWPRATLPKGQNIWLAVGAIIGAALGSKILGWFEWSEEFWARREHIEAWIGGKTIVGALIGGWIGVEIVKRKLKVKQSTGDAFVLPLITGMAIGRVGCFLTGLDDRTHGIRTELPWGVDFGDAVLRHPTQLYDIVYLVLAGAALLVIRRWGLPNGVLFCAFIADYLFYRFLVEFIKPTPDLMLGLSGIQIACLIVGIIATGLTITRWRAGIAPESRETHA